MTKEGIERKIESILQRMRELKIEYSDCEDQLSDLSSDLLEIERKEKELGKTSEEER